MSAHTTGRPTSVHPLPSSRAGAPDPISLDFSTPEGDAWDAEAAAPSRLGPFEQALASARQMEAALRGERARVKRMQEEFRRMRAALEDRVREADSRANESQAETRRAQEVVVRQQRREEELLGKGRALHAELTRCRSELERYQTAWNEILQREREARDAIAEGRTSAARVKELEKIVAQARRQIEAEGQRRGQAERHAESYQRELQNVLVRLHSAEGKFNELSREYQAMLQSRRRVDQEVAKLEKTLRECLKAELQREAALERETFRETARREIRDELDKGTTAERQRLERELEAARAELAGLREARYRDKLELEQRVEAALQPERERMRTEVEAAQTELERTRSAVAAANETLRARSEEIAAGGARIEELDRKVSEADARAREAAGRLQALESEACVLRKERAHQSGELRQLVERESALRAELESARAAVARLDHGNAEAERRLQRIDASLKRAERERDEIRDRLGRELDDARTRGAACEQALDRLAEQLDTLEARALATGRPSAGACVILAGPAESG